MNEIQTFQLADQAQQKRLAAFRNSSWNDDLQDAIALTKLLIEDSVKAKQTGLTRDLLGTLGTLVKCQRIEQTARGELCSTAEAVRMGERLGQLLLDTLEHFNIEPELKAEMIDYLLEREREMQTEMKTAGRLR